MTPANAAFSIAAQDPARARRLLAGLGGPRFTPPPAPPAIITNDDGEIVDIVPVTAPIDFQSAPARYPVRHSSVLVNRNATQFTPLSPADKTRLWTTAVAMEAQTKTKGSRGGCFMPTGLIVLNRLLFQFANTASGRCDPSLASLQKACALSRNCVLEAIKRLAQAGLITVTRRWMRYHDPLTNAVQARQITNAYTFAPADRRLFALPRAPITWPPLPTHRRDNSAPTLGRLLAMSSLSAQELRHPAKTLDIRPLGTAGTAVVDSDAVQAPPEGS